MMLLHAAPALTLIFTTERNNTLGRAEGTIAEKNHFPTL
jgi:hypothetical protein